jgi:hypothetical protein
MAESTYGQQFSDALVSEIKAEMGRRGLSSRKLGAMIGESSQYMSMRLDGGNPRTGERVLLSVRDLAAVADALGMRPSDLTFRAHFLAMGGDPNAVPPVVVDSRQGERIGADAEDATVTKIRGPKKNVGGSSETDLHTAPFTGREAATSGNTPVDQERDNS